MLLYAHGDVPNSLPGTIRVLDEMLSDFIIELCFEADRPAQLAGRQKVKLEDFKFACRKDPLKLGKIEEVFERKAEIDAARKAVDVSDDKITKTGVENMVGEELGEADDDADTQIVGGKRGKYKKKEPKEPKDSGHEWKGVRLALAGLYPNLMRRKYSDDFHIAAGQIRPTKGSLVKFTYSEPQPLFTPLSNPEPSIARNRTKSASIFVGEDMQEWIIPVDLLCFHSPYFNSVLQGGLWKEENMTVELVDEDPETFELIVEWLYTHEIKTSNRDNLSIHTEEPSFWILLNAWMLADFLEMRKLQNVIMKLMHERVSFYNDVPLGEFSDAYHDYDNVYLRAWIIDAFVWAIRTDNELIDAIDPSHFELLQAIFSEFLRGDATTEIFNLDDTHLVKE
ncbi:hypothetical protein V490_05062 [Pseudogymnoascus sp. VKM F-3557]|nr:hypothetical protein V490_05062 [Pseudogymnoascus sp. VKM F-3557]